VRRNTVSYTVNGVQIVNGDTPVENGNIMFISEILFVSEEIVNRLHQENRDKETPPLLAYTWMNSPFISHAYLALQKDSRFTHVTRYINLADVAPVITGHGKDLHFPKTKIKEPAFSFNPLKPELNPICYLLALLAHHFLHVSRIRVKSLTIRLLMSYIYMEHLFLMFLDHTQ